MYALFWFTGNPKFAKSGSEHLLAAAAYAAVGGVAAGVGRAVPGRSSRDNQSVASAAVNGGDASPRNATFNSNQAPVESSARALQDGSGGMAQVIDEMRAFQRQQVEINRQKQLHNAQ